MPIQIQCPQCREKYAVEDSVQGRRVRCKHCAAVFVAQRLTDSDDTAVGAPVVTGAPATTPSRPIAVAHADEADDSRSVASDPSPSTEQMLLHLSVRPLPGHTKLWLVLGTLAVVTGAFFFPSTASLGVTALIVAGIALAIFALVAFIVPIASESERTGKAFGALVMGHRGRMRRTMVRIVGGLVLIFGSLLIFGIANVGQSVRAAGWQFPQTGQQWADAWNGKPLTPAEAPPAPKPPIVLIAPTTAATQPDESVEPAAPVPPVEAPAVVEPPQHPEAPIAPPPVDEPPPEATVTIVADGAVPGAGGLAVVQRTLRLQENDRVLFARNDGEYAVLVGDDGLEQSIRRVDLRQMAADAELHLPAISQRDMALGLDGEIVLRRIDHPTPGIDVLSLKAGRLLRTLPVDADAAAQIVGFISPTQFLVRLERPGRWALALYDINAPRPVREYRLPEAPAGRIYAAPGGDYVALMVHDRASSSLQILGLTNNARWRVPLALASDALGAGASIAFSRDGKRLAALNDRGRQLDISIVTLADGKLIARYTYPGVHGLLPSATAYQGRRIDWMADDRALLLYGAMVIEPQSGRIVGPLGINGAVAHQAISEDRIAIERRGPDQHELVLARLDGTLDRKLDEAAQAGALLLSPPEVPSLSWMARVRPYIDPGPSNGKPVADPAPPPPAGLLQSPLTLPAASERIAAVAFARADLGQVLAQVGPAPGQSVWTGGDVGNALYRYHLVDGKEIGRLALPLQSRMLGVSPDGEWVLAGSPGSGDGGDGRADRADRAQQLHRLDVWSMRDGRLVAGFEPYREAPTDQRAIIYAALPDREGILTLNEGGLLVRWSIADHRAQWAWDQVAEAPTIAPGGKYLLVRIGERMRAIDARTGQVRFDLEAMARDAGVSGGASFSRDGTRFARGSSAGAVLWDITQGRIASILPAAQAHQLQFRGDDYLLIGERLFATNARQPLLRCAVNRGRHLYDSPDERHWYLSDNDAGLANLCAVALVPASATDRAQTADRPPSLLRPGAPVSVRAEVDTFSLAMRDVLSRRLREQGSEVVETGPVTLVAQAAPLHNDGQVRVTEEGNTTTLPYEVYACQLSVVSGGGNVLWRGSRVIVQPPQTLPPRARAGETVAERYHRGLVEKVLRWAEQTPLPEYVAPDGGTSEAPRFVLTDQMRMRPATDEP